MSRGLRGFHQFLRGYLRLFRGSSGTVRVLLLVVLEMDPREPDGRAGNCHNILPEYLSRDKILSQYCDMLSIVM